MAALYILIKYLTNLALKSQELIGKDKLEMFYKELALDSKLHVWRKMIDTV
jgi:hypothetical protein